MLKAATAPSAIMSLRQHIMIGNNEIDFLGSLSSKSAHNSRTQILKQLKSMANTIELIRKMFGLLWPKSGRCEETHEGLKMLFEDISSSITAASHLFQENNHTMQWLLLRQDT